VVGSATAHYLASEGHHVTLLERRSAAGLEASFGNGGQLSYSYVAPLAAPSILLKLPALLTRPDSPLKFRPELDRHQWKWCLDFLRACTAAKSDRTTAELLVLSALSRIETDRTIAGEALDFNFRNTGKLVFFRDRKSFAAARKQVALQARLGAEQVVLSGPECVARELALTDIAKAIQGGVLTLSEGAGDCHKFTSGLVSSLQRRRNVDVQFSFDVERLRWEGSMVRAAVGPQGEIEADDFVLAGGVRSRSLLLSKGISLPVYPLKGYSLTVPLASTSSSPDLSVTDSDNKIVYARLGETLRIAAMVDIGYGTAKAEQRRIDQLRRQVRTAFPRLSLDHVTAWTGLRPATPQGKPIIGRAGGRNMWINVGHGALGFTLACGSARLLADLIAGRPPAIDPTPFELAGVA
jgi:D-amino-acid dehydrogenase